MGWTPRRHHPCLRLRHDFPRMSGPRTGLSGEKEAREVVLEKAPLAAHEALVQSQSGSGTKASEDLELKLSFPHQQINEQAPSPSSSSPPAFGCPVLAWREGAAGTVFLLWRIRAKIFALSSPRRNPRSLTQSLPRPVGLRSRPGLQYAHGDPARKYGRSMPVPVYPDRSGAFDGRPRVWGRDWLFVVLPLVFVIRFQPYLRHGQPHTPWL